MKMSRKTSAKGLRMWDILRLAVLWVRKGGAFRDRLVINLHKGIKKLRHPHQTAALFYGHRQLSFDDTPVIHVKMHRPSSLRFHIPCIKPQVDFDYEFDDGVIERKIGFLKEEEEEEVIDEGNIDLKAEEFIANFYQQIKLQTQISYLHYNQS